MNFRIDRESPLLNSPGHPLQSDADPIQQWLEKFLGILRKMKPAVVLRSVREPVLLGKIELLATTEVEAMRDPDRSVAQRIAQLEHRCNLQRAKRPLAILSRQHAAPNRTEFKGHVFR